MPKRRAPTRTKVVAPNVTPAERCLDEGRRECIATAAYFLSKRRQAAGEPPDEVRDWLDAEREVAGANAPAVEV